MNRKYEILLLIKPNLDEKILLNLIKDIESKINGNIVKKENWGIKSLEYEIKKFKEAHYFLYYVETNSENIFNLKEMISINKNILRPMILKHEKKWPFEYKTASKLKFPERKPRKEFFKKEELIKEAK